MSALTKPLNHFSGAVAGSPAVPAEQVKHVEKVTFATQGVGKPAQYFLYFYLDKDIASTFPVKVRFTTSAARDTSYTNYIAANSAAIA